MNALENSNNEKKSIKEYLNTSDNTKPEINISNISKQALNRTKTNKINNFLQALNEINKDRAKTLSKANSNLLLGNNSNFKNINLNSNYQKTPDKEISLSKLMPNGNNFSFRLTTNKKANGSHCNSNYTLTEYDNNISEWSIANVHFSREEKAYYINHPVEKDIEIINNNIRRKRRVNHNSCNSANFPYKMDIILKPVLNRISEEDEQFETIQIDRNYTSNSQRNKIAQTNFSTTCESKCSNNEKNKNKTVNEFMIHSKKTSKAKNNIPIYNNGSEAINDLSDLDQMKDIDLFNYQFDSNMNNSMNKKLAISDLDLSLHNYNKHSKILIVDSDNERNNNFSNNSFVSNYQNTHLNKNKKFINNMSIYAPGFLNKKKNENEELISNNDSLFNINSFHCDSLDMIEIEKGNLFNKKNYKNEEGPVTGSNTFRSKNGMKSSTNKKIRRKYQKSEIFESMKNSEKDFSLNTTNENNRKKASSKRRSNTMISMVNKNPIILKNANNITNGLKYSCENASNNDSLSLKHVNKNLLSRFNEKENQNSLEYEINSLAHVTENNSTTKENEKEMLNLLNENEDSLMYNNMNCHILTTETGLKINAQYQIDDMFHTPSDKIRKRSEVEILEHNRSLQDSLNYNDNISCNIDESSILHSVFDLDFINNLLKKEEYYKANSNYLSRHKSLLPNYRAILIEWLMELCEEFAFKRDTFHYAVNYIDRFLSKIQDASKRSLQLIGVACLSIAAKLEEISIPKAEEYIKATENSYKESEFIAMEKYILKILKWDILPITINTWLNWYLCQWDLFIDSMPIAKNQLVNISDEFVYFKRTDEKAYHMYRQVTQFIDLFVVDYNSLSYSIRHLVASAMLLTLCINFNLEVFMKENINKYIFDINFFRELLKINEKSLATPSDILVHVFLDFLYMSFNLRYEDILESLSYAGQFLNFEFDYALPLIIQNNNGLLENVNNKFLIV